VTGASVGVGFAIPVDILNRVVPKLIAKGSIQLPRMGFTSVSDIEAGYLGFNEGVVVDRVEKDGPASRAGLQGLEVDDKGRVTRLGDVIVRFQGKSVARQWELIAFLEQEPSTQSFSLGVLRGDKLVTLELKLDGTKNDQIEF
jgi:S1-C subfamily serine protease